MNLKILTELDRLLKNNPSFLDNKKHFMEVINGTFDTTLKDIESTDILYLERVIDEAVLSRYFGKVWFPETKKYKYSGLSIIDEINDMNPEAVIDIGCGYNEFKGKIKKLIGIDPYNDKADLKVSIEEFKSDKKFDVAICLGSINFGSSQKIINEMKTVVDLVKDDGLIYFRVNPGKQHNSPESKWINFYDWDPVFISNVADALNCNIVKLRQDVGDRFYFVSRKNK